MRHPRRPRGKIIGCEEDKTAVSVGAKVYFSCVKWWFRSARKFTLVV